MSDLRALSVRQPWTDLIMAGVKDVENRTWDTDYRGWLLIHASLKRDTSDLLDLGALAALAAANFSTDRLGSGLRGMILGAVQLTDVVTDSTSEWAMQDHFHWLLSDPILFSAPIPATGQLGLWRPAVTGARIRREFARVRQLSTPA